MHRYSAPYLLDLGQVMLIPVVDRVDRVDPAIADPADPAGPAAERAADPTDVNPGPPHGESQHGVFVGRRQRVVREDGAEGGGGQAGKGGRGGGGGGGQLARGEGQEDAASARVGTLVHHE